MKIKQIMPGDKVDIRILQQAKTEGSGKDITTFISSVYDVHEDGSVELNMPTQGGKILLIPVNIRYEFVFTTSDGLFKAEGIVTERYKNQNFYLMKVTFTSKLEKFQRREYYRLNCIMPISFMILNEEIGGLDRMQEVRHAISNDIEIFKTKAEGTILDISGGGVRFVSKESLENVEYLLLQFKLENERTSQLIEVVAQMIRSEKIEGNYQYSHRVKFIYKDSKSQEHIIKYIFEEERFLRKKEQG